MRRISLCALGVLAGIGVLGASSIAAQDLKMVTIDRIIMPRFPVIVLPPPPPQAPQVQFRGCVYYEHAGWQGKWRSIPGGTRRMSVGASWNDLISSFACSPACRVVAFTDDFKGQRAEFATTSYVGDPWNDKISSMIAMCQQPF